MRRWLAAPLLFAALAALAFDPPAADAQAVKPSEESFNTADGVRLKGLFHKSPNGGKQGDAVVVLLYPPGPERTMLKGDWDGLIDKLNEAGFHVFRFDWRGHGVSTDITDPLGDNTPYNGFWVNHITGRFNQQLVKGFGKKPAKADIRVKTDINPKYFPLYVNDLAAARLHLDLKNDNSELNSSSIYLVGAGDTAALGFLWMTAEWNRPGVAPMLPGGIQYKVVPLHTLAPPDPPAGADVAGAVWLSAAVPPAGIPVAAIQGWPKMALKLRDNNKMLFMYGADDSAQKSAAETYFNRVLVAGGNKGVGLNAIDQTFLFPIAKTKLNGVALLGQKLDPQPEAKVLEYLTARQKDRVNLIRKNRNYSTPYYIDVTRYGLNP